MEKQKIACELFLCNCGRLANLLFPSEEKGIWECNFCINGSEVPGYKIQFEVSILGEATGSGVSSTPLPSPNS